MSDVVDEGERSAPDFRDYGTTFWHHRWLILLTVLVTAGAAIALSVIQTPVYEATTDLIILPSRSGQILDSSSQDAQSAARNVDTQVAVLRSKVVQDAATKELHGKPDVSISSSATSDVVSISARSTNARRAAAAANGYVAAYVAYSRKQAIHDLLQASELIKAKLAEADIRLAALPAASPELTAAQQQRAYLQQQLDQLQVSANLDNVGGARILAKADVPSSPFSPSPLRNVAIALVLGLLLGSGLAFLREHFDDTINSRRDLDRAAAGVPVLGEIPIFGGWRKKTKAKDRPYVVTFRAPTSQVAEAFRSLRASVQFLTVDQRVRTIQVTSPNADEGKTAIVANLAAVCARAGLRVVIVCCDLRRPRVHEYFGLRNDFGLTSVILGTATLPDALRQVSGEANLRLLSAGPPPLNPSELLGTSQARAVIESLEQIADLVLIDCPPVLPVSDAVIVSGMVDATLLVASEKRTSGRAVRRTVEMLRSVDAPLVGTVLNMVGHVEAVALYSADARVVPSRNGSNGGRTGRRERKQAARASR